jgi:hypothetical protein
MGSVTIPNNDVFMISSIKTRVEGLGLEIISISHSILDQFRDNWLEISPWFQVATHALHDVAHKIWGIVLGLLE